MRKILYLLPLLLIFLSLTPFSFYKQDVYLALAEKPGSNADLAQLEPRYWKAVSLSDFSSGSVDAIMVDEKGNQVDENSKIIKTADELKPEAKPLTIGVTFRGFPFGAFFSGEATTTQSGSTSSISVSAFSWLWLTLDCFIIILPSAIALRVNRRR